MTRGELPALTGLRAVAAGAVVLHHLAPKAGKLFPELPVELFRRGYLGVDVFFVLSGFVLAYCYGDRIRTLADYRTFVGYRLARIYPLHLATLLGVLAMAQVALATGAHVWRPDRYAVDGHLLLHLTLTHAWGLEEGLRYNLPSWSISAEFFAYLLFPAFWAVARRAGVRSAWLGALASTVVTVGVLRALGRDLHVPVHFALLRVTGEFLAGCLAYRAFALRSPGGGGWTVDTLLPLGVLAVAATPWADPLMAPAAVVLVYSLAVGTGMPARCLCLRPVLWLGRISYAIYLVHMPVLSVLERALPAEPWAEASAAVRAAVLAAHLAIIVGVSAVAFQLVEAPGRRWVRGWVRSRAGAPSWEKAPPAG